MLYEVSLELGGTDLRHYYLVEAQNPKLAKKEARRLFAEWCVDHMKTALVREAKIHEPEKAPLEKLLTESGKIAAKALQSLYDAYTMNHPSSSEEAAIVLKREPAGCPVCHFIEGHSNACSYNLCAGPEVYCPECKWSVGRHNESCRYHEANCSECTAPKVSNHYHACSKHDAANCPSCKLARQRRLD